MKSYQFVQMDVFSAISGAGNALAIVLDAEGLTDGQMQAIAKWTRLAETTYTFAPTDPSTPAESSYAIRMFSPQAEVPFAGHPSVGTATALLDAGKIVPDANNLVWQQGLAGTLPLHVATLPDSDVRVVAVRAPRASQIPDAAKHFAEPIAAATLNLAPGEMAPALMDGGRRWWVVQAATEAALRQWTPAWEGIVALAAASQAMGICAYAFADDPAADYQVVARALVGQGRTFEDAASGAANATLAAHLFAVAPDRVGTSGYVVSQGREVGHDAKLFMRRDADGEIWSGGQTVTAVRGTLEWTAG